MSPTTDRRIRDNRSLFAVVLGIAFLAIAAAGFYFWTRSHTADTAQKTGAQDAIPIVQPGSRNEPFVATVYYPVDGMLSAGTASIKRQPDAQTQAREMLGAALADSRAAQAAALRDLKLKAFYLDARGTAYIDLAPSSQREIRATVGEELLAIYAMVNTVMQNFEEIRQVVFLMDGREAQTLAGHIDLSRKFVKRMDLVKQ